MNIKVDNINPPIPIRCFDWVAWVDGQEEDGPYGYGTTCEEAIETLKWESDGQ